MTDRSCLLASLSQACHEALELSLCPKLHHIISREEGGKEWRVEEMKTNRYTKKAIVYVKSSRVERNSTIQTRDHLTFTQGPEADNFTKLDFAASKV